MGKLITELVGETNKRCFGTKRMPGVKKYEQVRREELTKHIIGAIIDAFEETDDREKCRSCRKIADFELDDIFLCNRCIHSDKCSKAIRPLVEDVLEIYDEKFGVQSESSDDSDDDSDDDDESSDD